MAVEVYMPQLGLTMTEGTIVRWLKQPGDQVRQGEPLIEVQTDKVTMEVEASASGVLTEILLGPNETAPIGAVIGYIGPAEAPHPRRIIATPRARRRARELGIDLSTVEGTAEGGRIVEADVRFAAAHHPRRDAPVGRLPRHPPPASRATGHPVARRLAAELGVAPDSIAGSGPGGRVTREDVRRAAVPPSPPAPPPDEGVEPLTGARRLTAERMAHSFSTVPHFYLSSEVDATRLLEMLERLRAQGREPDGVRLTITDLLLKMVARALADSPAVNAAWDDGRGGVRRLTGVHIGLATATERGLFVPVIRDADRRTLPEVAADRHRLAEAARAGRLSPDDLQGASFTLTNLGMYRVDFFQAIINPPQAAILAAGRIAERPAVVAGQVVPRPTLFLTLSADHRVLDGADAARFLDRVAALIEEPYLLLA
ncbi:MAG: 2-oxo acid dehydrogenase subunit E2 [Ardenticatenaceae bacterium]|nr:2-oxo acid dehydrogenase subunit E2 [Ardenticatenaceae bacterium]